jgi:hypothetical protein
MGLTRRLRLSEDDKKFYRRLVLIAVLAIFLIVFLVAITTAYAQWACIQIGLRGDPLPSNCSGMGKFALELLGAVIGILGAIKLLGQ